ncbi:MAG: hypothetical protein GJ676_03835 [Rhodobacteraceae bacterium]|nr:hypothetical protein [Paracoccaceae bacterium]
MGGNTRQTSADAGMETTILAVIENDRQERVTEVVTIPVRQPISRLHGTWQVQPPCKRCQWEDPRDQTCTCCGKTIGRPTSIEALDGSFEVLPGPTDPREGGFEFLPASETEDGISVRNEIWPELDIGFHKVFPQLNGARLDLDMHLTEVITSGDTAGVVRTVIIQSHKFRSDRVVPDWEDLSRARTFRGACEVIADIYRRYGERVVA